MTVDLPAASTTAQSRVASLQGTLVCSLSAFGFASLTVIGKFALGAGLSIATMLSMRFGIAALILFTYLALRSREILFPGWKTAGALLLLGGVMYAGQSTIYFLGLQRLPASLSSLFLYVYPVFVALLDWAINQQKPGTRAFVAMLLALTGVAFTLEPASALQRGQQVDMLGMLLVITSAAGYACYIMVAGRVARGVNALVSTAWISTGASISFLLGGIVSGTLSPSISIFALGITLLLALVSTIMPVAGLIAGIQLVGPTIASLLSTLEPVFTIVLGVLLLQETLSPEQGFGGMLVLLAVILLSLRDRKFRRPPALRVKV